MFVDAVEQEKAWAVFLFKDGSMIGLNTQLLSDYIEWICCKRMTAVGLKCPYTTSQAIPANGHKSGSQVQKHVAQETEISSYVIGGVKQDVDKNTFGGMSL